MLKNIIVGCQTLLKPKRLWRSPTWLGLEVTTRCNSRCTTCPRENYIKGIKKNRDLNFDDFKYIIDCVKPKILSLTGGGENFLNSDYINMIRYAVDQKILTYSTTNGVFLKENIIPVLDSGLNELVISLDGYNRETYKQIRQIDTFDAILANIRELVKEKKIRNSKLLIGFNIVLQNTNYEHLDELLDIAHDYGVNVINLLPMDVHFDIIDNFNHVNKINREQLLAALISALRYAKKLNISTNIHFWLKHLDIIWKKLNLARGDILTPKVCHNPWASIYINSAGDVFPCCGLITDKISYGNIFENSILNILNSKKAILYRSSLKKHNKPFIRCKGCLVTPFKDILLDMARRRLID